MSDAKNNIEGTCSFPPSYAIDAKLRERIENDFVHHPPSTPHVGERYATIRFQLKQTALVVCEMSPPSREQSIALTKLEEAMFWANAAVARNDK
jgi:hypothetical protein